MEKKKQPLGAHKFVKPVSEYHKSEYFKQDMENGYISSPTSDGSISSLHSNRAKTAPQQCNAHYIKTASFSSINDGSCHNKAGGDILNLKDRGRFPTEIEEDEDEKELGPLTAAVKVKDKLHHSDDSDDDSICFSDKDKNARLEEHMKLQHLQQLMQAFQNFEPPDIVVQEATKFFPAKVQKRTPGAMNIMEFKSTVNKVIGTNEYDEYLEKLFQKLDTSCIGYVDWNEFCTYMLLLYRENDYMRTKREIPFLAEPKIRHIVQNKQEQTTKIVASSNPSRYVTISKEGAMSVWYPSMSFEKSFMTSEDDSDQGGPKRRFKMWVTDAVYMPNCNKLAIASTSRDIRFFDCSTNQWFEEYHIFAMSDVPCCFDYWYDKKHPNSKSVLIFGVDSGSIHILYFHKPVSQLFETAFKSEGGAQKIFWKEIEKESSHLRFVEHEKILHDKVQQVPPNQIRQVQYIPDKNCVISSLSTSSRSVVISDIHKLKKQYVFNIEKGVECFDYNKNQNLLVTGGLDHIVRLWNAYVTNKPIATLEGHATGVIGVKIHEGLMQVFSYSKDAVVKVWDFREHTCLQSVVLKFPSSIHGRMPEHGQFPMHLQPSPQDALLVTCNDYIGMLKLGRTSIPQQQGVITHETQLCSAIYNPLFKQVVTGCDSSHVAVWELESGNKSIVFSNAHGDEEITAMVFDESWRRLITGARNGTIKVWNFQNGHNLHKLEAVGEAEVTGIVPLTEKQVILSVGWSRKIVQYNDSDPDNMYVAADTNWKGGQIHEDDILSMDYCLPYYLATAGFDGEITVWDLETEKIFVRLRKGQKSDIAKKIESIHESQTFLSSLSSMSVADVNDVTSRPKSSAQSSRPNSRHRKSHKVQKGQPVPVDKLLFLRRRCTERYVESAMLISSEAGYLRWWNLFAVKHELGLFYVPDNKDESILALCTNQDNSILLSGDTLGFIKLWDISHYCTQLSDRRVRDRPPQVSSWKAHDTAVVSVELIDHETGHYVVSASTDKTARLWTIEGHFIGTFGQKKSWNLKNKKTWVHPRTPWTQQNTPSFPTDSQSLVKNGNAENHVSEEQTAKVKEEVNGTAEVRDQEKDMTEEEFQKELNKSVETPQVAAEVADRQENGGGDFGILHRDIKIRSQTVDLGSLRPHRSQTFLGSKVANQLQQMKSCRIDRRKRLTEDIDFNITQRYGKLCSPFQALKTKDVVDVRIPNSLPLSQRMINKGYRSENMTEETLNNMDFSYGGPDSPPSSDQERKFTIGTGKQEKASTAGPKKSRQISAIKKNHTIA